MLGIRKAEKQESRHSFFRAFLIPLPGSATTGPKLFRLQAGYTDEKV